MKFEVFLGIIITLGVFFTFLVVTFIVLTKIQNSYMMKIKKESNTTRIFIIDIKNNKVDYFNRSDMRNKKVMDLVTFYNKFHPNDIEKVKAWISSICMDYKTAAPFLEADVLVNKGKSAYFSLLKLLKYDPAIGLIHIESHLLKFLNSGNIVNKKHRGMITGVVKRSEMAAIINKNKSLRGYTFAIRFFYIKQKVLSNDKIERYMIMSLKNEIYPFASNRKYQRQIIDSSDNELILFDIRLNSKEEAMLLANSIAHTLKKFIGVNGFASSINFSIGVVENANFYQDFESIVSKAQEACISAQQNNQPITLYQKSIGQYVELNKFAEQIDQLMEEGKMRYLFRPIVDVSRKKTIGYFEYVKAYNSPFTTFAEISKYAAKVGKNRKLFALVANKVITKFDSEKQDDKLRLFFHVSLVDLDNMIEILPQIPNTSNIHLVLVFDEQEINEASNQIDLLIDTMKKLHVQHYELALSMKDKNLLLDDSVYYTFDYFIAGAAMIGEIKKNNRIRLSIHTLIEQLLKYNRPIIATDLEGWQAIELIIKSGITKLSSEVISASNDMLLPVESKKMDKLAAMDNSFN